MSGTRTLTPLLRLALAAVLILPLGAAAPAPKAPPVKAHALPLLDRELFFGNPEIAAAQLSPDGQYIAFLKPWKETRNIWVKKTGEPYSAARLVTAEPKRPVPGFFWSRDSARILFVQDRDGDENFNVYAVDPAAGPAPDREAPAATNLTSAKGARAIIYAVPKAEPGLIFVGLNDRDAAWHDLYQVKIATGERTLLRKNTERIATWVFDRQGKLRLATRTTADGGTEILRVDPEGFTRIYACGVFENAGPVGFHKDGQRVYLDTNTGARDLGQLVLLDIRTGKEELVDKDPLGKVDFGNALFSDRTDELQATTYEQDRTRIYFRDKALAADFKLVQSKLPGREVAFASANADETLYLIAAYGDTDPGSRYLFNRKTKQLTLEYISRERLPRERMAPMKPIRYPSSDGLSIPAYLTLPKGVPAKGLPLVVVPHGGPWARDGWGFNNYAQFLANRGYAVLQPNFRGSTGFGKKFLNAGNLQWGDRMQDDLTWGVKALVKQGIADPKRIGIMGGSYGGYATLAGVAFTPELYQAGVSIVGPSNLLTLLETIPPYWESIRTVFHKRMGDPTTPEGRKQLERQSPLNSAQRIKTPLMVVQGANDPRVKKAESEQIVIALRDRQFPVAYLCAPDEGHGFQRPVNNMALYAAAEQFLAKHLHGAFQEGGSAEVMARLPEITVDPATVVLAPKVDPAAVALPAPAAPLKAGTYSYKGTMTMGSQSAPIGLERVVKEEAGAWTITDTAKLPMGEAVDTATLDPGTLVLRRRTIKQGPVSLELAFKDGAAQGTMTTGGGTRPITGALGGELFGDGAGGDEVLAHLPLALGYSLVYRTFDVQKAKPALKQLKVLGQEAYTGPAGSCAAWKVELTSAEGNPGTTTLWVAADSRRVLKTLATLPQMGGAVITLELQP